MKFKQEGEKLYAKLDYESVTENGLKIYVDNIFSLTENGAYFDWGLEKCGFGQFSFSFKEGKWTIMNECMGPETSYSIIKAFEEAIRASGDEKAIYCLNKIISLISYRSNSLCKSMLLIWNSAEKEGGEVNNFEESRKEYKSGLNEEENTEKNIVFTQKELVVEDLKLYTLSTNHYSFSNKKGSFYEATLDGLFDLKYAKHGLFSIEQRIDLNSGEKEWFLTENMDGKTLAKIFKTLEQSTGEYQKIWTLWKNAVKLNTGVVKMAKTIAENSKKLQLRYPVK